MKKQLFILSMLLLFNYIGIVSQNASITIQQVTSCQNFEVMVPVSVENFSNIGAISLYIGYDTTQLNFETIINIHPSFQGLLFNQMNYPQPQIGISYTSLTGTTLISGVLFDMKFFYKNQISTIGFLPNCEIVSSDLEIIEVTYNNGNVMPLIQILNQPTDMTVIIPNPASFSLTSTGGNLFQWQCSNDEGATFCDLMNLGIYSGVTTQNLVITNTSTVLNGNLYRCKIANGNCFVYTTNARLKTLLLQQQIINLVKGWNGLSTYLTPSNSSLDDMFLEISGSLILLMNNDGIYFPAQNINTIGTFNNNSGYAIKLSEDALLTVDGIKSDLTILSLADGWNYLPVLTDCEVSIDQLFSGVTDHIIVIKELPGINVYWPEMQIFSLQTLLPGKSYMINTDTDIEVEMPICE